MKKIYQIVIVLLFIVTGCQSNNKSNNKSISSINISKNYKVDSSLNWEKICNLKENNRIIGKISSFDFLNDSLFIVGVSEQAQIVLYNSKGKQLQLIGNKGRGPYEYINPSIVKVFNNKIYVWCKKSTRLIVFNSLGKPINQYNFSFGIKDFSISNNYIGFYTANPSEPILKIYNLEKKSFIKGYGDKTNEQKILNVFQNTGGITSTDNKLFFIPNNKLIIYEIDVNDLSSAIYIIQDSEFKINKKKEDVKKFIMKIKECYQYYFKSDIIDGLFHNGKGLIVKVQIKNANINQMNINRKANRKGKLDIKLNNNSSNKQKFYVFDNDLKLKYSVQTKITDILQHNDQLYMSHGEYLYLIKFNKKESNYELNRINLYDQAMVNSFKTK